MIMANNDRMIAKAIIMAEAASDSGKGYLPDYTSAHSPMRRTYHEGYDLKGSYILRAIKMISSQKKSSFSYSVTSPHEGMLIIYFESSMKVNGRRLQVSFHMPDYDSVYDELSRLVGKGKPMVWNGIVGGSIECCDALAAHYDL
jgi:hypothetical protein